MEFRQKDNGNVLTKDEVMQLNPTVSFPLSATAASALGLDLIVQLPPPEVTNKQEAQLAGIEQVNGVWQVKWEVVAKDAATMAAETTAKIAISIQQLWEGAHGYESKWITGIAIGVLTIGVVSKTPKALAIAAWDRALWAEYYRRKAALTGDDDPSLYNFDFMGTMPYSIPEVQQELGL